jgi:hypothetical protein
VRDRRREHDSIGSELSRFVQKMSLEFGDVVRGRRLTEFRDLFMLGAGKLAEDGDVFHLARRKCLGSQPQDLHVRAAGSDREKYQA